MIPDIVEIKRLCASGQWIAKVENEKIFLHDTVAGETVCIGRTDAEPVRHGQWIDGRPYTNSHWRVCSVCHKSADHPAGGHEYCGRCGAKMDGGTEDAK